MKQSIAVALSSAIALGALAAPNASAQGAGPADKSFKDKYLPNAGRGKGGSGAATDRIQKTIDIDVVDKDLREIVEEIGRKVGKNILVAPGVEERITVTLRDLPWPDAVKVVAGLAKCDIEESVPGVLLLTQPPKVTIQFQDANVRTVLQLLAAYSGKNIIISPDVKGKVSLDLKNVHWLKALKSIVSTVGPYVVVEDGPDLLRVVPRESIERQLETVILRLKYIRPPARYQAVPPRAGANGRGGGAAAGGGGNSGAGGFYVGQNTGANLDKLEESFTLFKALRGIIEATPNKDDVIQFDQESNSFFLTATAPVIAEIQNIVSKVDLEPAQLFIELRFISTSDRNFLETGLKFSGGDLQNGLQLVGPFPGGQQVQSQRFLDPFVASAGQQQQAQIPPVMPGINLLPGGNLAQTGVNQPLGSYPFLIGEGYDLFASNFRLPAILDFSGLNAALNLIDSVETSRILQEPSLFTLDNQAAVIFVGENIPYAATDTTNDINGNVQQGIRPGDSSPVAIGFSLFVEPHVVPETESIILTIIPRVNNLSGTTSPVAGFDRFAFSADAFIDLPRTSEQAIVTRVMVEDGQTAVIGGLLTEQETIRRIGIPLLSDIPLIGPLFINKVDQKETRNLVIFVTPTIVRTRAQGRSLFQRVDKRQKSYDKLFQRQTKLTKKAKKSTSKK